MAYKWFPIHIPISETTIIIVALLVGVLFVFTRKKQYSPINVQIGPDGQPGNPTGQQGIDYRAQQDQPQPYQVSGANVLAGPNSWV